MKRRSNWPRLLADFLREKQAEPFDWARNNCAFFAADWLALSTGVDPAADLREEVTSALSAGRVLRARGGLVQIAGEVCFRWEWPEIAARVAQRGDIAVHETPQGPALGVVLGAQVAFAGASGVVLNPLRNCATAWRIG